MRFVTARVAVDLCGYKPHLRCQAPEIQLSQSCVYKVRPKKAGYAVNVAGFRGVPVLCQFEEILMDKPFKSRTYHTLPTGEALCDF